MSSNVPNAAPAANAFAAPGQPTLLDVLAKVMAAPNLTAREQRDYASALNTFAKAAGTDLDRICANPGSLGQRLSNILPAVANLSPARWANVKSLVRKALVVAGINVLPGRYQTPLTPNWLSLHKGLPDKKHRDGSSRLAHYCSAAGITPAEVNDTVMAEFFRALTEEAVITSPEKVYKNACRTWNSIVYLMPMLGLSKVTQATANRNYVLPMSFFPESLHAEVVAWIKKSKTVQLFAPKPRRTTRKPKPIRDRTAQNREWQIRQAATILLQNGWELDELGSLSALVEVDAVTVVGEFLYERNGETSTAAASLTTSLLRSIARDWINVSDEHLGELDEMCETISYSQVGLTDKNRKRLRILRTPENKIKILTLPQQIVAEAKAKGVSPKTALMVQTALMVELLLMAPMRIGNLAELDLEKHFMRSRQGIDECVNIVISRQDVKNDVELDFPLPPSTIGLLDLYISKYRGHLGHKSSTALFPGDKGSNKCIRALSAQLTETIARRTGIQMNPQLFRHFCAIIYLEANPGNYEVVRRVLGHKSIKTTMNFYVGLETQAAFQHFDASITKQRGLAESSLRDRP